MNALSRLPTLPAEDYDAPLPCDLCGASHDDSDDCDPEDVADFNFDPLREHGTWNRRMAL